MFKMDEEEQRKQRKEKTSENEGRTSKMATGCWDYDTNLQPFYRQVYFCVGRFCYHQNYIRFSSTYSLIKLIQSAQLLSICDALIYSFYLPLNLTPSFFCQAERGFTIAIGREMPVSTRDIGLNGPISCLRPVDESQTLSRDEASLSSPAALAEHREMQCSFYLNDCGILHTTCIACVVCTLVILIVSMSSSHLWDYLGFQVPHNTLFLPLQPTRALQRCVIVHCKMSSSTKLHWTAASLHFTQNEFCT